MVAEFVHGWGIGPPSTTDISGITADGRTAAIDKLRGAGFETLRSLKLLPYPRSTLPAINLRTIGSCGTTYLQRARAAPAPSSPAAAETNHRQHDDVHRRVTPIQSPDRRTQSQACAKMRPGERSYFALRALGRESNLENLRGHTTGFTVIRSATKSRKPAAA